MVLEVWTEGREEPYILQLRCTEHSIEISGKTLYDSVPTPGFVVVVFSTYTKGGFQPDIVVYKVLEKTCLGASGASSRRWAASCCSIRVGVTSHWTWRLGPQSTVWFLRGGTAGAARRPPPFAAEDREESSTPTKSPPRPFPPLPVWELSPPTTPREWERSSKGSRRSRPGRCRPDARSRGVAPVVVPDSSQEDPQPGCQPVSAKSPTLTLPQSRSERRSLSKVRVGPDRSRGEGPMWREKRRATSEPTVKGGPKGRWSPTAPRIVHRLRFWASPGMDTSAGGVSHDGVVQSYFVDNISKFLILLLQKFWVDNHMNYNPRPLPNTKNKKIWKGKEILSVN